MESQVNLREMLEKYQAKGVFEIEETVGIWEFHIKDCPVNLKIKVVKVEPQGKFMGIANYGIKNPRQASYYWSMRFCDTMQEALEDALRGFLRYWDPKEADKTDFKLLEDW
ncbi:MAG: hypothetical protein QXX41_11360 [Nitrososphaerota archaeon]